MTVIGVGDLQMADGAKFPGIVIEATRDELQVVAGNILYKKVEVVPAHREDTTGKNGNFCEGVAVFSWAKTKGRSEMETDYKNDLGALERACEEVLDAETLKKVVATKRRIQGEPEREIISRRSIKIPIEIVPTCSMAAMRDALLKVKKLFDGRIMFLPAIREAHKAINAALSEPPRNCDRFGGDVGKLREACLRERGLNPEEDFPDVFPDWLLAPSTEGGAL